MFKWVILKTETNTGRETINQTLQQPKLIQPMKKLKVKKITESNKENDSKVGSVFKKRSSGWKY